MSAPIDYQDLYEQACEQLDAVSNELAPQKLWGFFYSSCIFESAAALVSLHRSKRSAWKAMHRAKWAVWENARSSKDSNLHLDRHTRAFLRCPRSELSTVGHYVRAVEVLE